jgi:RsiW-degrading membrane proteinase PrsW (M82 family)
MNNSFYYALLGGVLPALLWLYFWLREDRKRPEPRGRILETFLAGMVAVIIVLPIQRQIAHFFPGLTPITFLLWAISEEVLKFGAAYFTALRTRDDDEPVDSLIYLITAALGFVALENTLFIWNPLLDQNIYAALSTGGLRFLGASLLHVVASGTVGILLAMSFYKSKWKKVIYGLCGILLAVVMHTTFNLLILSRGDGGSFRTFALVWLCVAILLIFFEKVKTIARPKDRDIMNV